MSTVTRILVLTGGRKGFTGVLGKQYKCINGKITLRGPVKDVEALTLYLGRCYEAFPKDSDELEAANGERNLQEETTNDGERKIPCNGDIQPNGSGSAKKEAADGAKPDGTETGETGVLSEGDGHQNPRVSRIEAALSQLDTVNDDHWTSEGLPAVAAVEGLFGEQVTRAEITAVAPDFNRIKE